MTDNRERAIAEVAEEIGWTTEQVSYCTYSVMCMAVNQCEKRLDLLEALEQLANIIRAAGVINLSRGVQLGQISWSVKCNDALEFADAVIAREVAERKGL